MGRLVCDTVADAEDLELVVAHDPGAVGVEIQGLTVSDEISAVAEARADVVMENLARWHSLEVHAVVGTSGFDQERIGRLHTDWNGIDSRCLVVPNFSIGAVVMMRLAEVAAPHFDASEIIELHHDRKADAPSGTSIATAMRMTGAGARQDRATESEELIEGARGAQGGEVPLHSVRLPGLLAHQMVMFGNPGETLTIRHDSTSRRSFMPGVLLAIRGVAGLSDPVTVGLEPLLGL
jgi:4-hydroxy-tetrahydrodipicolinate reductase